jgi:hypothetical protein
MNTRTKSSETNRGIASMDPQREREIANGSTAAAQIDKPLPRLGEIAYVKVGEGLVLINSEAGAAFTPGVATPVTVTPTILRRLQDQDLSLAD